ncbi:MAG: YceD family protein [Bacteroidetes bacterium]|nr:YceD family protein [Bacteroidota bacterium]MCY4206322.1 YceD family protein [Bacteroidota bacterium]
MLKVDITLPWSGNFEVSASELDLDDEKFSEIQVTLSVMPSDGPTRMTIGVCAKALLECDRTLCEFVAPVSNSHELSFWRQHPYEIENDMENDMTEQIELDPAQRVYDLTDVVRDTLMLAVPARNVAPEAEELQIQTVFGAPTSEADQRWSPLIAVREELSTHN